MVLLAAHAEEEILQAWRNGDVAKVQNVTTPKVVKVRTLDAPWDLLDLLHHALGRRVANMTSTPVPSGVHVLGDAPVRLEKGAKVDPGVVLDAEAGGIWIEANASGSAPGRCWLGPYMLVREASFESRLSFGVPTLARPAVLLGRP